MNQDFKFRFDEMLDNKPQQAYDSAEGKGDAKSREYAAAGHTRNLCFAWPGRDLLFLSYSYLVACRYSHEQQMIMLAFTTHTITLKGVRLEALAYELMQQLPRIIECVEERYNTLEERKPIVNHIEVVEAS